MKENSLKGIVQQILTGVESGSKDRYCYKLEVRQIFTLNFKGTPSREEQKTIFSGWKITYMALPGQIDAQVRF